jgi:tight adherence protein C
MSSTVVGGLIGLAFGAGLWMAVRALVRSRRPALSDRVAPYLFDLPEAPRMPTQARSTSAPAAVGWAIFGPSVRRLAQGVEKVLGGTGSVRRRLDRLGSSLTADQFRVEQVQWGLVGFAGVAGLGLLWSLRSPVAPIPLLLLCGVAFLLGVLGRDWELSRALGNREERMLTEFPTIADLMALSVAAGEGPVAALERVVTSSRGELSAELGRVLGDVRTGTPIGLAMDRLAARSGVPIIARFAEGLAVALDRGTPLVDVLHAQAADVREAQRRTLIETGARKEVLMMVPVVFLIMPITIVFAFYPGWVGLNLTTP